jgi:uncharacterized protein
MVKAAEAGRVKTRLARGLGTVAATAAYRAMQSQTIARLAHDRRWRTILSVSPDQAVSSTVFERHIARIPQGGGGLGQRLQRIVATLPPGPVVIIGSDIPMIAPADIARAFQALGGHDAVIGPSDDGGYWLIGLKRAPKVLRPFTDVRWSSAHACDDTIANLAPGSVAKLRTINDVDMLSDYARQRAIIGRRIFSG